MDVNSESSNSTSDVDPQLVVDSLKNMDDLDAELFATKKISSTEKESQHISMSDGMHPSPKKKVSFKEEEKEIDFDPDDPLADLLSDEDLADVEQKLPTFAKPVKASKVKARSSAEKKSTTKKNPLDDGNLFADEDDDLLLNLGDDKEDKNHSTSIGGNGDLSNLDNLLSSTSGGWSANSKPQKYRFNKDLNLTTETSVPQSPAIEELSFGSYQPSTVTRGRRSRENKQQIFLPKKEDDFFNFLKNDIESDSRSASVKSIIDTKTELEISERKKKFINNDFLQLGEEVDLSNVEIDEDRLPATTMSNHSANISKKVTPDSKTKDEAIQNAISPTSRDFSLTPQLTTSLSTPEASMIARLKRDSPSFAVKAQQDSLELDFMKSSTPSRRSAPPMMELNHPPVALVEAPHQVDVDHERPLQSSQSEVRSSQPFLDHMKLGFHDDLVVTRQTYEDRIKSLRDTISDMRSRMEGEVEAIKESYNMRLDYVRKQMREQFHDETEKCFYEQEEIKRLRSLHLSALEDTRLDYEQQIARMKDAHIKDMEALKSSTLYVRNLDFMMDRVDKATEQLEKLSTKYESAFHAMTLKWNEISSENKRFTNGMQTRLDEMEQRNTEVQLNVQETVSRLEGNMNEMSRLFREQHYKMQMEYAKLEACQSSLSNERKTMMEQISQERAEAMKTHREAIELRQNYEREARDENERIRHREEEVRVSQRIVEEARASECKLSSEREQERRRMENELARERISLAERSEKLSALEAKLSVKKDDFEQRSFALKQSEKLLEEKMDEIKKKEEEMERRDEKHRREISESALELEEARKVEREQTSRLNEIHMNSNELSMQRQLLAEERKQLIEDRVRYSDSITPVKVPTLEITPNNQRNLTRLSSTPKRNVGASAALWLFTAQQDRNFLEDERFFLETLKQPQEGHQGAVES